MKLLYIMLVLIQVLRRRCEFKEGNLTSQTQSLPLAIQCPSLNNVEVVSDGGVKYDDKHDKKF